MMEKSPIVVTISRQMGSGGSYVGYSVAKELGFTYIDRELLRQAAERLGTDAGALENLDERSASLLETIMKGFSFGMPEISLPLPQGRPVDHRELFAVECNIMKEIAGRYSAVIVGRAGFYALKDHPEVLRVFIHAPKEFRVERLMKAQHITNKKEVQDRIKESDQVRSKFVRDMAGVDWRDACNYHLCIDSSVVDFPAIVAMIVELVKKKVSSDKAS
jgi:cytidylate kinase